MEDDQATDGPDQASLFPKTLGDRLREAREAMGLSLTDIANRTRVPMRHLEAIETNDYSGMASPTYAIGFAKSYARAVGLDERTVAAELRQNSALPLSPSAGFEEYSLDDPKRVPSRGLAMIAAIIGLVVLAGVAIWYGSSLFRGDGEAPAALATPEGNTIAAAPEAPAPTTGGQVTLTATDSVWLRVYDATGKSLFEKTMQQGERYDVPADANNPMINIGRPDKIQVTINGSAVAPLGDGKVAIKDVPISAAALQARGTPAATPTAAPTPAPAATGSSTPKPSRKQSEVPPAFRDAPPAAAPTPAPAAPPPAATATPAP